jgi:general L-amino acid transport system permease protein
MAYAGEAPKQGFRLSMLIYDTRYRSMTIQVIVLILVGLFFSWLINNTIQNLAAKDRSSISVSCGTAPGMTSTRR